MVDRPSPTPNPTPSATATRSPNTPIAPPDTELALIATATWGTATSRFGLLDSTVVIFFVAVIYATLLLPGRPFALGLGLAVAAILLVGFRGGLIHQAANGFTHRILELCGRPFCVRNSALQSLLNPLLGLAQVVVGRIGNGELR